MFPLHYLQPFYSAQWLLVDVSQSGVGFVVAAAEAVSALQAAGEVVARDM